MTDIILHGSRGRMGRVIMETAESSGEFRVVCCVDSAAKGDEAVKTYASLSSAPACSGVVLDFSHHSAVPALVSFCTERRLPLVVATTALEETDIAMLKEASEVVPVFHSFNMSIGINLIAKIMGVFVPPLEADFNMEIIEKHHNQKKDSPSGTALLLADAINGACGKKKNYIYGRHGKTDECKITDMGIHAVRGGTIPGEHTIIFAGDDEVIEIKHSALSRKVFARGALAAAKFTAAKEKGFYTMKDML